MASLKVYLWATPVLLELFFRKFLCVHSIINNMNSHTILICCMLISQLYSQPPQQQCTETYILPSLNEVKKFTLNLKCHSLNTFCVRINTNPSNIILRVDFPPNKCISLQQDYPPTQNGIWKLQLNKTCCNIFGGGIQQSVQLVAMARKGFVFGGFPIADDIYSSYSLVIGTVLVGVLVFVVWERYSEKHEKVE